jgi:hypothetical protein
VKNVALKTSAKKKTMNAKQAAEARSVQGLAVVLNVLMTTGETPQKNVQEEKDCAQLGFNLRCSCKPAALVSRSAPPPPTPPPTQEDIDARVTRHMEIEVAQAARSAPPPPTQEEIDARVRQHMEIEAFKVKRRAELVERKKEEKRALKKSDWVRIFNEDGKLVCYYNTKDQTTCGHFPIHI